MNCATPAELMTIAASRMLSNSCICFVGIGIPSKAANLARLTHAPNIVLIYESGTIGTQPSVLPLSIGDEDLACQATTVVSAAELFSYWVQAGRIEIAFLGAAQVDKFANINTTVIGDYRQPEIRLPGCGGAPEIAAHAKQTLIMVKHDKQKLVERVDFVSTAGYLDGGDAREKAGLQGGPSAVITDLAVLRPEAQTRELVVTQLHAGADRQRVVEQTGWPIKFAPDLTTTPQPTEQELSTLRDLESRTQRVHDESSAKLNLLQIGKIPSGRK